MAAGWQHDHHSTITIPPFCVAISQALALVFVVPFIPVTNPDIESNEDGDGLPVSCLQSCAVMRRAAMGQPGSHSRLSRRRSARSAVSGEPASGRDANRVLIAGSNRLRPPATQPSLLRCD